MKDRRRSDPGLQAPRWPADNPAVVTTRSQAMTFHLRVARPVSDLDRATALYCAGLDLRVLGRFEDHDGFDGVMLGADGAGHHLEFTRCRTHAVVPAPTPEDLLVVYLPDAAQWQAAVRAMQAAGFKVVPSFNPYWDQRGRTFEDPDGYRTVLQQAAWLAAPSA